MSKRQSDTTSPRHGHPARGTSFHHLQRRSRTPRQQARLDADPHEKPPHWCDHRLPFRAEEFVDRAILDEVEFEYLYNEGDDFHFMNTKNYELMQMSREELGRNRVLLDSQHRCKVEFFEEKAIGVDLPDTMDMKVVQTEPTLQKATAQRGHEPATLETGLVVQVPPFVNEATE